MFWNNVKLAIRNLRKHKGFATINIVGLAIGLVVFVFGGLLVEYERTHDTFFENSDRTYTIGVIAEPDSELPVGVMTALVGGPFFLYLLRRRRGDRGFL